MMIVPLSAPITGLIFSADAIKAVKPVRRPFFFKKSSVSMTKYVFIESRYASVCLQISSNGRPFSHSSRMNSAIFNSPADADRMAEIACKEGGDTASKRLVIAHCNNPERAEHVKEIMCKRANFREVVITNTAGVATVYAGDGGIIMTL